MVAAVVGAYAAGARGRDDGAHPSREEQRAPRQEVALPTRTPRESDLSLSVTASNRPDAREELETDCEQQRPGEVTADLFMTMLRDEIRQHEMASELPLEARANQFQGYVDGWISGINSVNPSAGRRITAAIVERLCSAPTSDLERLTMARTIQSAIITSSENVHRGIDCALNDLVLDGQLSEDIVTWEVLDAWSAHGRRPSAIVEQIRQQARDHRTISRLDGSRAARRRSYEPEAL